MNYRLIIQYDGTRYDGWQRQGNTSNTIQGKLESVLSRMTGQAVEIQGAGRTDAGVHALGQVASVHLPDRFLPEEILSEVNLHLPRDIAVVDVQRASERFHARLNAVGKTYRYTFCVGSVPDVFRWHYQTRLDVLPDLTAMRQAADLLIGTHDFRSFCSNKRYKKSTIRTVDSISINQDGAILEVTFHGNGFLYNMVRIMTGTLLEVGQGKRNANTMPLILAAQDRQAAGPTAPAQGLMLVNVDY